MREAKLILVVGAGVILAGAACARRSPMATSDASAAPPSLERATVELDGGRSPGADAKERDSATARALREALVREVAARGHVQSDRVLDAMRRVPRHLFVPGASLEDAYRDAPLPIGEGQTISQPAVVGWMSHALELEGGERVLEIGTGSGYQAAVLAELAREVYSIEVVRSLGEAARERLRSLGHDHVHVRVGDGYAGWPDQAPFDRILLTAAPPEVPKALLDQLADGGVLVAPVGAQGDVQQLLRIRREGKKLRRERLGHVRFVPMVPGR
jgi:protein-L-isoaspartate(D-aspartate) O-methyltransferase